MIIVESIERYEIIKNYINELNTPIFIKIIKNFIKNEKLFIFDK